MKTKVVFAVFLFAFCLLIVPSKSYAQKLPIYSANGFECAGSALKGSKLKLVTCEGSFPKDSGNLTASGYASVSLTYGKGGNVYSYSSLTGCMMHATAKTTTATNRSGKKEKFPAGAFDAANEFCSK
jgi:hypothetical protein